MSRETAPKVGLFPTCLVDLFRPNVGFATARLMEETGFAVEVPVLQTCCGQPTWNNGDRADTIAIARQVIAAFEPYDYVVVPSGSCAGQLHKYPEVFADDPAMLPRAEALAGRTYELFAFLVDVARMTSVDAAFNHTVTYHDSCSSLRPLAVKQQPRRLLASVSGLELREMGETEVCCGFGGTFCVKYPEISTRMVNDKIADIEATGAETVLAGDLGCLMNIAGRLSRLAKPVRAFHTVEVLAGMTDGPAIGEAGGQA